MNPIPLFDVVVIGSGISGLVSASVLAHEHKFNVSVVEALNRMGGRTKCTDEGIDLGAAWSWPAHDKSLGKILKEVQVTEFIPQDMKGRSVMQIHDGKVMDFAMNASPSGEGSIRIASGAGTICKAIAKKYDLQVQLNSPVARLTNQGDNVVIETEEGNEIHARAVIVAMPPRQAASIEYSPSLEEEKYNAMLSTPTWMGQAGKVCLTFSSSAPWKEKRMNGTFMSHKGPISQCWDNSNHEVSALCGFVFEDHMTHLNDLKEQLAAGTEPIVSPILDQLSEIFGPNILSYKSIDCETWEHTDKVKGIESCPEGTTNFGDPLLSKVHQSRVFFAGTETQRGENGHMEGAVKAGLRAADEVKQLLLGKV